MSDCEKSENPKTKKNKAERKNFFINTRPPCRNENLTVLAEFIHSQSNAASVPRCSVRYFHLLGATAAQVSTGLVVESAETQTPRRSGFSPFRATSN
jgi:hypothetical protein